jgi:hypothetical protein
MLHEDQFNIETFDDLFNLLASSIESLQAALVAINEEIGCYPSPITACDVHFNSLLERRRLLSWAMRDIEAWRKNQTEEISIKALQKIASALTDVDSNLAASLIAALEKHSIG